MTFGFETLEESFSPGDVVGDYTLLERLGKGGQAVVWSVWDEQHGRVAAAKFVPKPDPVSSLNPNVFTYEANVVTNLKHPNILPVYDVGTDGKRDYLVMRYMCCGSLQDLLNVGPLSLPEVLELTAQIVAALDYIHRGREDPIVHRDLKPRNIMLDSHRRVFLSDFGLARPLSDTTQALHTGQGTIPYAPPEQHLKAEVSPSSDIYSLGVMIYEMATGKLPWDGSVALAIRQLNADEELPDPRLENPALPGGLAGALRALTAADPGARPSSGREALSLIASAVRGGHKAAERFISAVPYRLEDEAWAREDADYLLQGALRTWDPWNRRFTYSLTHFRFMDGIFGRADGSAEALDPEQRQFMLRGALTYGHDIPFWWDRVDDPAVRLEICEQTIANEGEAAAMGALEQLLSEPTASFQSEDAVEVLVGLAEAAREDSLRRRSLDVLRHSVEGRVAWQPVGLTPAGDEQLARLALSDAPHADQAARLIGQARSEGGVKALLAGREATNGTRTLPALVAVRDAAGSLPHSLPRGERLRVAAELGRRQLLAEPNQLVRAYLLAALASGLGLGFHVFATYRLPRFLDSARILNAVGSGLLFGLLIGLGIFLTSLIVHRLRVLSAGVRLLLGTVVGTLMINLAIVGYHSLFLDSSPVGGLIVLGAFVMATGLSVGALALRSRLPRALLSAVTVSIALGGTWSLAQRNALSPILYYEPGQTVATALLIVTSSVLIGLGAQAVTLSPREAGKQILQ